MSICFVSYFYRKSTKYTQGLSLYVISWKRAMLEINEGGCQDGYYFVTGIGEDMYWDW